MDTPNTQDAIGKALQDEVAALEREVFGVKLGGWTETGLTLGQLRKLAELKRQRSELDLFEITAEMVVLLKEQNAPGPYTLRVSNNTWDTFLLSKKAQQVLQYTKPDLEGRPTEINGVRIEIVPDLE